jgi:CBS domain-containing protein
MSARAAWRLEALGFAEVYRYVAGKQDWTAAGLPVDGELAHTLRAGDAARHNVHTCRVDERIRAVSARLNGADWQECVIVNEQNVVLGLLRADALASADPDSLVEDVMDSGPVTFRPDTLLQHMVHQLQRHGQEHPRVIERVLVTTADGELVGVLHLGDAEAALAEANQTAVSA